MEIIPNTYSSSFAEWQSSLNWQKISEDKNHIAYINREDTLTIFRHPYQVNCPLPPQWQFKNAFDAVFYNDFFDRVYLDDKVKQIFKDSVNVDTVMIANQFKGQLMFDCDPCNVVGQLHFKGTKFNYPATLGPLIVDAIQNYSYQIIDDQSFIFTTDGFTGKIIDAYNNKSGIVIKTKNQDHELSKDILSSFKLKME